MWEKKTGAPGYQSFVSLNIWTTGFISFVLILLSPRQRLDHFNSYKFGYRKQTGWRGEMWISDLSDSYIYIFRIFCKLILFFRNQIPCLKRSMLWKRDGEELFCIQRVFRGKANSNVGASITSWLEQNSCGGQRAQFEYGVRTRWY